MENQLFPSLIGISPLITIHYKSLLRLRIRSSSFLSKTFNLIIISSRRFRVYKNLFEVEKRGESPRSFYSSILRISGRLWRLFLPFLFALRLINFYNSLTHYAKGTSFSSDCFFHIISSSFHSILMVLFILPSRYFYTINHWFIFLVCGWFTQFSIFFFTFIITLYIRDFTLFFLFSLSWGAAGAL